MRLSTAGLVALALGATAAADEVVLKNGFTLEGIVTETEDRVTVEIASGSVTVPKDQVREIRRDTAAIREFEDRRKAASTTEEHYQLAQWASERGMKDRAEAQYRRVIALDPGHKAARQQLGYVEHEGRWVREDEYMALKGFVRHEGRWVPWDVYQSLRRTEMEAQTQRLDVLEALLQNPESPLPRRELENRADRILERTRTAPWNWGVRGGR